MSVLFARCPACNSVDTQPDPTGAPALYCQICEDLFPVDGSAVKPDGYADAVRAAKLALFRDNLIWITTADNPAAKAWGGPTDALNLAAEVATEAVFRVLAEYGRRQPEGGSAVSAAWSLLYVSAMNMASAAEQQRRMALAQRCPHYDSGGAQCTADAEPEHEHRYRRDDLPGYDPTEF